MPPLPFVPNVVKVTFTGGDDDSFPWENVIHYIYAGGPPATADLTAMAAGLSGAWATEMSPLQNEATSMVNVSIVDLSSDMGAGGVDVTVNAGTRAGATVPANAAVLISYTSARRFRGGHPRQYLVAGSQPDLLDPAHWTAGFTAAVTGGWDGLTSEPIGATFGTMTISAQCYVSYYNKALNPVKPYRRLVPLAIALGSEGGSAQSELASQRRRIGR